ncbi:MAG: non-heme iron oxygenase ferredoxin subunit [Spirochaetaceae bacterium]|nr:MAG: non-heme iron oxygenase ferredoxin subunit [Spirochaetaceae bacterium]
MAKWVKVCNIADFSRSYLFRHKRKEYALFKLDDGVFCLDNVCSHEYSPLAEGMVLDGDVYCPKHGSRFDIKTGSVKDYPATRPVKTFEVSVDDAGDVSIKI